MESRSASRALITPKVPLNQAEYFNRKLKLVSSRTPATFVFKSEMDYEFDVTRVRLALKLPYSECFFITNDDKNTVLEARQKRNGDIHLYVAGGVPGKRKQDHYLHISFTQLSKRVKVRMLMKSHSGEVAPLEQIALHRVYGAALLSFLHKLTRKGTKLPRERSGFHVVPDADERDGWSVVKVNLSSRHERGPVKGHQGGTHASPREHTRAGHWRTSKLGKKHWVGPMLVNKGIGGKISKHYEV